MKKLASNLRESARFNQQVSDSGISKMARLGSSFILSCQEPCVVVRVRYFWVLEGLLFGF
jgi:hypothetical protein